MSTENQVNINDDLYPGRNLKTICLFDVDGTIALARQVSLHFISKISLLKFLHS